MYIFENSGIPNGSESVRNFLPNQKSNMPSMKVCVVHPGGEKSLGFNVFHYPPRVLTDMTREYFKVVSATSGAICKDCWKKFSHRSVDKMGQTEQPSITTMVRWFIYFCINFFLLFSFALLKADEMLVECSTGKFSTQTRQNFQEFEDNMKETNVKPPQVITVGIHQEKNLKICFSCTLNGTKSIYINSLKPVEWRIPQKEVS